MLPLSVAGFPTPMSTPGLDFAHFLQSRRSVRPNQVRVRYRLVIHLQLLPTSSLDDAVTFGYRPESTCLRRTFTSLAMYAARRTGSPLEGGVLLFDRDVGEKRVLSDKGPEGHTESSHALELQSDSPFVYPGPGEGGKI